MRKAAFTFVLLALLLSELFAGTTRAADDRILWKPVEDAILRIDDRPAKTWNVYRPEKKDKSHLLLVEIGRRFLLLDLRAKEIFELVPEKIERKGKELLWREQDKPASPLPSTDWTIRDAGRTRRIRARLEGEGRVLDVQLPQMPDLRGLY